MPKLRHQIDVKNNVLGKQDELQKKSTVYNTKRIEELNEMVLKGGKPDTTPFFTGKSDWKDAGIIFEYTDEELDELAKCANDCIYFVEHYCKFLNDNGRSLVKLRDYQKRILKVMAGEHWDSKKQTVRPEHPEIVMMQARQTGKCLVANAAINIDENAYNEVIACNNEKYSFLNFIKSLFKNN
ncbi:MAG: terminase large subunit [Wendovervirus sonii]|uniref:Terminase large subunit n=1 Tax=phage Lak_Megaphage_Sonny TaxID=3109229 RepID=A0ABZ0Z339_9CAUD|nr:MAG: terminase large subunit [phage Lak_Megaphage_Sonny]